MKNMMNLETLPTDLRFVPKKDMQSIESDFATKYAQVMPKTTLQKNLSWVSFKIMIKKLIHWLSFKYFSKYPTREETFRFYRIEESSLFKLYEALEKRATDMKVCIKYVDMTGFSEDEINGNTENLATKHAETARSDGKTLSLERELSNAGGIQGRTYDLLHLAFGHMVQWSTDDPRMLLTKEEAWAIGYRNHDKSPDIVVDMMSFYEFEAGMMAIEMLQQTLESIDLPSEEKERILQYFTDYVYCDRGYIIQHYRGNHESFQKFWKFGQPIPPRREFPKVSNFIERDPVEIGLIQDKHS